MSANLIDSIRLQKADEFYFFSINDQGRKERVWVNKRFVTGDEAIIKFPIHGGGVEVTPKGTIVIRPNPDTYTIALRVDGGFRGGAKVTAITPEPVKIEFTEYASPRGSLGYSIVQILTFPSSVTEFTVTWGTVGAALRRAAVWPN